MIKLENVILASPEQMEFIIQGMRNSMNSWEKSDSHTCRQDGSFCMECKHKNGYCLGANDHSLMQRLAKAGTDHRKFMRMMPVYVRITAPLYWWEEFDTKFPLYKVDTVANSCSTMHKIAEKEFTLEDFSCEHLISDWIGDNNDAIWYKDPPKNGSIECPMIFSPLDALIITIGVLNMNRETYLKTKDKKFWWQMIQLLPSNYNQTRNVTMNYEILANIYRQQKNYKLDEWREFCKWIKTLPYSELITGEDSNFEPYDIDEETAEAIIRSKFPNIDSAKDYIQSRLAEDDPKNFGVGKITSDLITKELNIDIMKQILEENSK